MGRNAIIIRVAGLIRIEIKVVCFILSRRRNSSFLTDILINSISRSM